ncbi:MAG: valine--tRNA ligase [Candidatus Woesearchaeota archaeon]|nr:MAG: valine--tRNA ligase [Candidatus Woesearchaeota archaeon]
MNLPKDYNFKESEKKWQKYWEKEKIFSYSHKAKGKLYSIDTPPPTVSGKMHIGHAFSYSHEDFISRYKRMKGCNVWYPFGTDDNGLPTERLIEKIKNVKAREMRRDDFVKLCLQTLKEIRPSFINDWIKLGMSCDFTSVYSTIDDYSRKISQKSFLDLSKKNLVYQEETPVSWCTTCNTAIAQAEFEDRQLTSHFNDVVFKVDNKDIIISTTRPELLPACVAVFVNPNDKRHKNLVGKKAKVPLFNYYVPILTDEKVDMEKGTGIVMCCTFGDFVDVEWWRRYKLPLKVAVTKHGLMSEEAQNYKELTIKKARHQIIEDLEKENLLKEKKQITHVVNVHDKCGTELEILKTKQWYIKILENKKKLIEQGKKTKWHPEFMLKRYINWVENLQWDWCISRQRFFGVPFPIWYCKKCSEVKLAEEKDLPVDPLYNKPKTKCKCGSSEFIPESDVMDTWATSSCTPQIVLDWDKKGKLPMSLRPQAHDIIRTWAFYTIVKSFYHFNKIPWNDIMISGFVTLEGQKMSKSKGNIVDPSVILENYGADALRFWSASAKLGENTDYMEKEVVAGQRTIIKLWNASKFSIMNLKDYTSKKPKKLELIDKWILIKLNKVVKESTEYFESYDYSKNKMEVEKFFWNTFCDNYLEIIKFRLYGTNKEKKLSAQYSLYNALISILKMFAPIMPHITEEIWQLYFKEKEKTKSIHISNWPEYSKKLEDKKAEEIGDKFIEILGKVRQFKASNKVSLKTEINLTLDKKDYSLLKDALEDLKAVVNAREIKQGTFSISL